MLRQPMICVIVFIMASLLGTSVSQAGVGTIRDSGEFFSEAAKSQAKQSISKIEQQFKKDLVIETFTEIPDELKQGVDLTDRTARNKLFEQWAVKQAKQEKVNGVYILLSRDPAHIQIVVGNETRDKAFTLKDRDNLASLMLGKLRCKQNDDALSAGVDFVLTTMASHSVPSNSSKSVSISSAKNGQAENTNWWVWIAVAVIGIGGIWLIMGIVRAVLGGRAASAAPGMSPGFGGGGMFGSLLGGMFGAAAGMWLYDQFSGSHGNAWGADEGNRNEGATGYSGQDTDYSGTGGDFGGDSGGGDFGDGGGGDF